MQFKITYTYILENKIYHISYKAVKTYPAGYLESEHVTLVVNVKTRLKKIEKKSKLDAQRLKITEVREEVIHDLDSRQIRKGHRKQVYTNRPTSEVHQIDKNF